MKDYKPSQKSLLSRFRCWDLVSTPRNILVCLRIETRPALNLNQNPIFEMVSNNRYIFEFQRKGGGTGFQMTLWASQNNAIPMTTVPPKDLVLSAKINVGSATQSSGCQNDICRGMPLVTSSGKSSALRIAAGIRSSHSTNHWGRFRRDNSTSGNHRGT